MARRVTITDVARAAGVSVATVSKVLNDRYDVAQATSARVKKVIDELGYESSLVARSLRSQRTGVVGILVAEFEPFSAEILKGVSTALCDGDYEVLAYTGGRQPVAAGWERRYLSRLSGTLIDGALLVTPTVGEFPSEIPVVAIDPHTEHAQTPTVAADNYGGALLATRHLISLGHRRIGFMGGRADLRSSHDRERGYRRAMADAGLDVAPSLLAASDYRPGPIQAAATALLSGPDAPTAVFAANDQSALGLMRVAESRGMTLPRDLSVVGFDNIPDSAACVPALTTVEQPIQDMGRDACRLLLDLLSGRTPESIHLRLPTSLVLRASTAPPGAGEAPAGAPAGWEAADASVAAARHGTHASVSIAVRSSSHPSANASGPGRSDSASVPGAARS